MCGFFIIKDYELQEIIVSTFVRKRIVNFYMTKSLNYQTKRDHLR